MIRISCFGDFKVNDTENLGVSGELKSLMEQSDVNLLNFEAPLESAGKPIPKSGPTLFQCKDAAEWVKAQGFNVVSIANNHIYDYGKTGLQETMSGLRGLKTIGGGRDAYSLESVEIKGLKIGFLAATHCEFGTSTNGGKAEGAAWISHPEFIRNIIESKKKVDYLLLIVHAGIEYFDYPLPEWRDLYKLFIDLGADAVIGSHPHVPQGWEFYKGRPICYSLGNFCFQTKEKKTHQYWNDGLVATLELDKGKNIGLDIRNIGYTPQIRQISFNDSPDIDDHINEINLTLSATQKYAEAVDREAIRSLPRYYRLFAQSGLVSTKGFNGYIKGCVKFLLGKGWFPHTHALNNLQCESHRWLIIRGMKLLNK